MFEELVVKIVEWLFRRYTNSMADRRNWIARLTSKFLYWGLMKTIDKNSNEQMISNAYWLTDYLDKTRQPNKASALAKKLLQVIPDPNYDYTFENIRKTIGCYYSVFKNPDVTREELQISEEMYRRIAANRLIDSCHCNPYEKLFLHGIFESNYGALCDRKAAFFKDSRFWDEALDHHNRALAVREKMLIFGDVNQKSIYTTKRNIAGIYYKQGLFRKALNAHREILRYQERNKLEAEMYTTKRLMLGCFSKLQEEGELNPIELNTFQRYLEDCKEYYQANDIEWMNQIIEIETKLTQNRH